MTTSLNEILVLLLKLMTGSTLSGRVWNVLAKLTFLLCLIWHEWPLQVTLRSAAAMMPPVLLSPEIQRDSTCPVLGETENTTFAVYGYTVPTGAYSAGIGHFKGPIYNAAKRLSCIEIPSMLLLLLVFIRVCGFCYLNPAFARLKNARTNNERFLDDWVFRFVAFVHFLTEIVFVFLVYHSLKNMSGYEEPKALWKEGTKEVWLNWAGNTHLAIGPRYKQLPPGTLDHHIMGVHCRNNHVVSVRFWNDMEFHNKGASEQAEIRRSEHSYHTGVLLRFAMRHAALLVVLSIVLGVLSQAIDNSSTLSDMPKQYLLSRANSEPGSPVPSPRADRDALAGYDARANRDARSVLQQTARRLRTRQINPNL